MHKILISCLLIVALIYSYLPAYGIPSIIRGPYLQAASSVSIVIRWRTDEPTNSRVRFGSSAASLDKAVDDNALVNDHEIKLTGLKPKTRYFYSVGTFGSFATTLQGDNNNFFETTPVPGSIDKYRIGVLGDCGNNSVNQMNVRNQVASYLGNKYMNAWILLGDNAYSYGLDAEYQSSFFNIYKDGFLKNSPLYPSPGNHDYADNPTRQNTHEMPYYDVFTMPKQGEAGGVASQTEAYYSFDYGNIHFLSLDSYGKEDNSSRLYDTLGKQVTWIKQDLAANQNKDWVVAYWHHPPYTMGSHNSDIEGDLVKIRTNFIRILERNGVDLILCGHSHDYERSKLMQGHYGLENSLDASLHNLSSSSGKYDGTENSCPYEKSSDKNRGTVYVVSGSAGQLGGSQANYPHDAMPFSDATNGGGMVLEVEGNRLDAKWIGADGIIRDQFTLEKDVSQRKAITLTAGKSVSLNPSYIGSYLWSDGKSTKSITVSPNVDTDYIVKDAQECISDTFNVKVSPALPVELVSFNVVANETNQVTLSWVTSSEKEAAFFLVERSEDGKSFNEIVKVDAAGHLPGIYSYAITDSSASKSASKKLYYRLKQVDLDGSYAYSRMISVTLNSSSPTFDMQLVPNPSSGHDINIMLTTGEKVVGEIEVFDISGRQIFKNAITVLQSAKVPFAKTLPAGTYFFRFVSEAHVVTRKLVVN